MEVSAVDYHTAGEPFRIVTGGIPPLPGGTILEKRRYALEHLDHVRELLVNEPRGHADMYGGFPTEPEDAGADLGVVFFHNAGYSTACGHGTIALVTWAIDTGMVRLPRERPCVVVDVPSGRIETTVEMADGRVTGVRFRNVPSFVLEERVAVETTSGRVEAAIAFGGAFYAIVDSLALAIPVQPAHLDRFIALGREVKAAIESSREVMHPLQPELRGIYGVIFTEGNRNVTVFADGEVDRSPCGSGTSARLALLDRSGELPRGSILMHESIIGTRFSARVVGETEVARIPAVITEVEGSAYRTGDHHFVLDPRDPLHTGFLVR
ncbi:MAG: proline racemase [Chloroflexi bacterium]|nr:MAG: proline racemase [Chloroflexota bacterium]